MLSSIDTQKLVSASLQLKTHQTNKKQSANQLSGPALRSDRFKSIFLHFHFKGGDQKKGFYPGPVMWVSYFGLWAACLHNFPCCVGWVPLPFQKASGSPFSPKSDSFLSIFTYLYPNFSVLALFTPILPFLCFGHLY